MSSTSSSARRLNVWLMYIAVLPSSCSDDASPHFLSSDFLRCGEGFACARRHACPRGFRYFLPAPFVSNSPSPTNFPQTFTSQPPLSETSPYLVVASFLANLPSRLDRTDWSSTDSSIPVRLQPPRARPTPSSSIQPPPRNIPFHLHNETPRQVHQDVLLLHLEVPLRPHPHGEAVLQACEAQDRHCPPGGLRPRAREEQDPS